MQPAPPGWEAYLELGFAARAGRTVLARRAHRGPLVVQRPFYPEGDVCHAYLIHPPGGVVGGDRLAVQVRMEETAHALLTTPAAGKFYRSAGATAVQTQHLSVASGALLEWLPQETILYAGSRVEMTTRVELAPGGRFIGWEIVCLGRPAAGEAFHAGAVRQRFEVWRDGAPLFIDRARIDGASPVLQAPWGLGGRPVTATLAAIPAGKDELAAVRKSVACGEDGLFSATLRDEALVCRYLGHRAEAARGCLAQAWAVIRPSLAGRAACMPRIWRT